MTKSFSRLALGLLGLVASASALEQCGDAFYDPEIYVCYNNQFLCPVINGEPLGYCNGACYSRFMYRCENSVQLALLPHINTPFSLTVSNPKLPAVNGQPISACGQHLWIGPPTCSYCPEVVGSACPAGTTTGLTSGSMNVMVPGGQQMYLDAYWNVGYTQAHSAYVPPGATIGGLVAYEGGGFINMNPGATGWVACPPTASGGGGTRWNLVARNDTNAPILGGCTGVNLATTPITTGPSAWQYT